MVDGKDIDFSDLDMSIFGNKNNPQTIPDYQNVRNALFQYSQQFNNSVINYKFNQRKGYWIVAVKDYMKIFYHLREENRLKHLTKKEIEYLHYFYYNVEIINLKVLRKLNMLVLKVMNKYGIYNIAKQNEMYR